MAQFDVYKNINENSKDNIPYLLDIQNDIFTSLSSKVVVPLIINTKRLKILNKTATKKGSKLKL